jgi:predicted metalloprotease
MGGGRGGMSITTLLIIGALMLLFGVNPLDILKGGDGGPGPGGGQFPGGQVQLPPMPRVDQGIPPREAGRSPFEIPGLPGGGPRVPQTQDDMKRFVSRVLADTEDVWGRVFQSFGRKYEEPKLVIFDRPVRTACGRGVSAMGPFYCPPDKTVYIDLNFFEELRTKLRSPGDFAQAYVIAHEVGHHVQNILGIAEAIERKRRNLDEVDSNRLQVMMELQADCLAGVWANLNHQLKNRLEAGDIEEGLNAASQIGDDMLQRQQTGRVVPESFTHGSSAQRMRWFKRGFETGQIQQCDTFSAAQL